MALLLLPMVIFLIVVSWDYVSVSWAIQEGSREAGGLRYPFVPVLKSLIPLTAFLLLLQGIADLLGNLGVLLGPEVANVVFMAGRKFGTSGQQDLTWAMNVLMPALVAERFSRSRIVAFSTGTSSSSRDVSTPISDNFFGMRSESFSATTKARNPSKPPSMPR